MTFGHLLILWRLVFCALLQSCEDSCSAYSCFSTCGYIFLYIYMQSSDCTCSALAQRSCPCISPGAFQVHTLLNSLWSISDTEIRVSDCVIKSLTCIILKLCQTINTCNHVFCFCFLHSIRVNLWIHNQMSYLRRTQKRNIWIAITELDSSLFTNRTSIIEAVINLPTYIYPSLVPKGL